MKPSARSARGLEVDQKDFEQAGELLLFHRVQCRHQAGFVGEMAFSPSARTGTTTPLITTAPITAIGTFRRGFCVSSANGAAASNPPKASTARLNVSRTSVVPPGQLNGLATGPRCRRGPGW